MDLATLLGIARRWWWALLLAGILAGTAGYITGENAPRTYESRVRLLVGPLSATDAEVRAAAQLTRTYAELVTSDAVILSAIRDLDLPHSPDELREAIRPTADSATRLLIVRVRDSDPDRAQQVVTALADSLRGLTTTPNEPAGQVTIVDAAREGRPTGLSPALLSTLATLAGLLAATTLVLLREYLSERVREDDELASITGVDHLGNVPHQRDRFGIQSGTGPVAVTARDSARALACRILATKIELIADDANVRSLLVVGVGSGQGAADVTANLAVIMAERGRRITVVDANTSAPDVTALFNLRARPGLIDLTAKMNDNPVSWDGAITGHTVMSRVGLTVMPVGLDVDGVSDALPGPRLVSKLQGNADLLVVNAPPADRSAAALDWARSTDATLLVVPSNVRRTDLRQATETLRLLGVAMIGMVTDGRPAG